ncbi:MAG: hypothetical protein H0Z33_11105 [Bacillaceae bacterium]|nr:hypothetical protein [Bacillaceae bacterium]
MIHPELCKAENTTYWTAKRIQFNLLLVEVAAWDGFIPLTKKQLAEEMNTTTLRINKFIRECLDEGVLAEKSGHYFLTKYIDFTKTKGYVRHFAFLRSQEFISLPVRVQRFILHVLSQRIYMHDNMVFRIKLDRLYHHFDLYQNEKVLDRPGIFNLYSRQDMMKVLDQVKRFFSFDIRKNSKGREILKLTNFTGEFKDKTDDIIHNRGKHIWVLTQLENQGYTADEVHEKHLNELVSIMDHYVRDLGFHDASVLFNEALDKAVRSMQFHSLMEDEQSSLRNYFLKIMHEVEMDYAARLANQADQLQTEEYQRTKANKVDQTLSALIKRSMSYIAKKIEKLEERWKKRFASPEDYLRDSIDLKTPVIRHMRSLALTISKHKKTGVQKSPPEKPFKPFNWLEVDI